jgi:hypothetical protein
MTCGDVFFLFFFSRRTAKNHSMAMRSLRPPDYDSLFHSSTDTCCLANSTLHELTFAPYVLGTLWAWLHGISVGMAPRFDLANLASR